MAAPDSHFNVAEHPETKSLWLVSERPAADPLDGARLLGALLDAVADAGNRSLVLIGSGGAFLLAGTAWDVALCDLLTEACERLRLHRMPVVAAICAPALDAALELALATDIRYVAHGTEIGMPGARNGRLPVASGQRLIHEAGVGLATRLLLLGEVIQAGMDPALDPLVKPVDDPKAAAASLASELAGCAPLALQAMKTAIQAAAEMPPQTGFAVEADLASLLLSTADRAEGIAAFRDRRPPRFRGR